jgi:predicted RNA-binding Zn ribbon-like protein
MQRIPAIFIADEPALDFLNSLATPVDVPVDWLADGDGLLAWLEQARLVPAPLLDQLRSQSPAARLQEVAREARILREWFRGFVQKHRGRALTRHDLKKLAPLNRLLERDESFNQIVLASNGASGAFELRDVHRWRSPEALLLPIAQALARFVCSSSFIDVKACEGPTCTLLFADHTRGRVRRWCSMALCGNRAKQAAHRRRLRQVADAR